LPENATYVIDIVPSDEILVGDWTIQGFFPQKSREFSANLQEALFLFQRSLKFKMRRSILTWYSRELIT
jgi:hypothetical protein